MSQTQELSPGSQIHLQILRSSGMTLSSDINKLFHGQTFYVTEIRFYDSIPSPVIDNICQLFWVRWAIMIQWSAISKEWMKITNEWKPLYQWERFKPYSITKMNPGFPSGVRWTFPILYLMKKLFIDWSNFGKYVFIIPRYKSCNNQWNF